VVLPPRLQVKWKGYEAAEDLTQEPVQSFAAGLDFYKWSSQVRHAGTHGACPLVA